MLTFLRLKKLPRFVFITALLTGEMDMIQAVPPHDMARIAAGAPLPALGEGSVCEFCAVRGLCRKDYWADAEQAMPAPETP